jgi:preprotein translocase subunit SecG
VVRAVVVAVTVVALVMVMVLALVVMVLLVTGRVIGAVTGNGHTTTANRHHAGNRKGR